MEINFYTEDVELPHLDSERIINWLLNVASQNHKSIGEISYIFCSDAYLLDVNKKFLQHDYLTDVITFDYTEDDVVGGDIFISTERIADNAIDFNVSFSDELLRVIVHGVLHLIGFNDKTESDQSIMTDMENKSLQIYHNSI